MDSRVTLAYLFRFSWLKGEVINSEVHQSLLGKQRRGLGLLFLFLLVAGFVAGDARSHCQIHGHIGRRQLESLQLYIKTAWQTLTRSNADLVQAAFDPKSPAVGKRIVYVAHDENRQEVAANLRRQIGDQGFSKISLRQLPQDEAQIREQGLLYLPFPYVVPGGRFNEMYGWDSYFIQIGLLRDNKLELARNMADNLLYEIAHYGKILNANRTYYLTRSQPPFLTEMILNVFRRTHDRVWLAKAVPLVEKYHDYWTNPAHLTPESGLSRYYDSGTGPAPEVSSEKDAQGRSHYDRVRDYFRTHLIADYDVRKYYDNQNDRLTPLFYVGDRSMRESGFDPSNRFGPFNIDVINYNPVCLNCLLYVMEIETSEILRALDRNEESNLWKSRASCRKELINRLCWDAHDGLYYDYNFATRAVRRYPFATTFYPLWAGIADATQASRLIGNLNLFERPGGLQTSTSVTGDQWDAPFGWAPLELLAVEGMRRYGYDKEADRVSVHFLSLVLKEFITHHTVFEKYDVARRVSQVAAGIKFGYSSNEVGFGWTNAAFVELYAELPEARRSRVLDTS